MTDENFYKAALDTSCTTVEELISKYKLERQQAKAIILGRSYGMRVDGWKDFTKEPWVNKKDYKLHAIAAKMPAGAEMRYGEDCRHQHIIGVQIAIGGSHVKRIKIAKRYRVKKRL